MKIGIFGGTFSPPHIGHIRAAEAFCTEMELDKIIIIPTFISHNKDAEKLTSPDVRLEMCRLAFEGEKYEVSDMEIKRGGKSYTADTVAELRETYPNDELYILFGADMFIILDRWVRAEVIFKNTTVVCAKRANDRDIEKNIKEKIDTYTEQFGAEIRLMSLKPVESSSSAIREKCRKGEELSGWVTPKVAEYIRTRGLYK